jgi:hypothetical protein
MLYVILRYNESGDLLQGYGQVTWPEHTFTVPLTCHITRMINKKTLKGNNNNNKNLTTISAKQCCISLQLQGPSLE